MCKGWRWPAEVGLWRVRERAGISTQSSMSVILVPLTCKTWLLACRITVHHLRLACRSHACLQCHGQLLRRMSPCDTACLHARSAIAPACACQAARHGCCLAGRPARPPHFEQGASDGFCPRPEATGQATEAITWGKRQYWRGEAHVGCSWSGRGAHASRGSHRAAA